MINVAEIIFDPDFAQNFVICRKTNQWIGGRPVETEKKINMRGVITVANSKDLEQLPEGDRVSGLMCFYSTKPIYITGQEGTADVIIWRNEKYRINYIFPYVDYGYYKAIGIRIGAV